MKYGLILLFMLAAMPVWAEDGGEPSDMSTELIFRSPLRDIQDDGVDLTLKSKEKFALAQALAKTNEELAFVNRKLETLMTIVEKNDGRIDRIVEVEIVALEKTAAELRERQAATGLALKEADEKMTSLEGKVTKLESRVVEVTNWANDVWNRAQTVYGQSQQALSAARAAEDAARPRGLEKLISWIPGLGH